MKREHWLSVIVAVADQTHRRAADRNWLRLQPMHLTDSWTIGAQAIAKAADGQASLSAAIEQICSSLLSRAGILRGSMARRRKRDDDWIGPFSLGTAARDKISRYGR
jgi:hypothetical protein